MRIIRDMLLRLGIAKELVAFFWRLKMWWMIPMVMLLMIIGLLIGFGSSTGVGPFIYTLF